MNTNRIAITIALALGTLLAAGTTSASMPAPGGNDIDQRQAWQRQRIAQGVASGRLTPREARQLKAGQARIDRMEAMARADGWISPSEHATIRHAQVRQGRQIARALHDRDHR